ncbi:hypothetical protein BJY01DRAFT_227809 [Aspergillus pseudoustus]|uniref:Uncharacterized protein n=1 Tax=Aspergillus pseudoustus TaxID=1810923 RepID=A0ABR4IPB0_9EURO
MENGRLQKGENARRILQPAKFRSTQRTPVVSLVRRCRYSIIERAGRLEFGSWISVLVTSIYHCRLSVRHCPAFGPRIVWLGS